jgi:hypothetical protein
MIFSAGLSGVIGSVRGRLETLFDGTRSGVENAAPEADGRGLGISVVRKPCRLVSRQHF